MLGAGMILPQSGTAFVSVKDADKDNIVPAVEKLVELGFTIIATGGTAAHLAGEGAAGRARSTRSRRGGRTSSTGCSTATSTWSSTPPRAGSR